MICPGFGFHDRAIRLWDTTVTGTTFLDILENYVVPQIPRGCFFQPDGAPSRCANIVMKFQNEQFRNGLRLEIPVHGLLCHLI